MDALAVDVMMTHYLSLERTREKWLPEGQIKVVVPLTGARSIVRVIEIDGAGYAVARILPRREIAQVKQRALADELAVRNKLNVPKILDVYTRDRSGGTLLLEEFVEGWHPSPETMNENHVGFLADVFARLHSPDASSRRFGPIGQKLRGQFSNVAWGRMKNRFRSVRRWAPPGLEPKSLSSVKTWFRDFSRRLDILKYFSLIHDKPNRGNVIWNEKTGSFFLIDLTTMRYGYRAKDLAQITHEILGDEVDMVEPFLERYFARGRSGKRSEYESLEPFYHAYYHLSQCAINCRRRHKYARFKDSDTDYEVAIEENWRAVMEIVKDNPV